MQSDFRDHRRAANERIDRLVADVATVSEQSRTLRTAVDKLTTQLGETDGKLADLKVTTAATHTSVQHMEKSLERMFRAMKWGAAVVMALAFVVIMSIAFMRGPASETNVSNQNNNKAAVTDTSSTDQGTAQGSTRDLDADTSITK
jgi:hypothetical protein